MARDAVEQIKERLSIVDVVASYVELHKAGKNYKGKSPFTNEKTPSFYVSPDRGMYYCFSSSQGGDIFTFVEVMEGVDFKGALKILAEKAGVELVPEDPKKRTERDREYLLLEEATKFFGECLTKKQDALGYLKGRCVKEQTIGAWQIGYAPGPPEAGWREVREHLLQKKFTDNELHKAGLTKTAEKGKAPYDVFRDRIMFPIRDASGRVVGFSGRILSKESDAPKYVNSPETELFNKSEILFGYDKAKQGIRKFDFSLIVEGQFDVVLTHQAGYTNAVAVSGTALTPQHVALLARLSNRVVLALDADRAGIAAVKRAADLMLARGMDVKVARLPNGQDPADLVAKDPKQFKEVIGHAVHVIEFLLAVLKEEARDERTMKLRARDEIVPYLLRIESQIDREHFEGVIADALGTTVDAVRLEVSRLERSEKHPSSQEKVSSPIEKNETGQVRKDALIYYCLAIAELIDDRERQVLESAFEAVTGRSVSETRGDVPSAVLAPLLFHLESEIEEMKRTHLYEEIASKVNDLHSIRVKEMIREKRELLTAAERAANEEEMLELTTDLAELQRQLGAIALDPKNFIA